MRAPSAAHKCCLLRVYASDGSSEVLQDWASSLSSVRRILEPLSIEIENLPARSISGKRNPAPKPTAAVIAWATLLADLVKRAKASLGNYLSSIGPEASSDSVQHLLELAWMQLDALQAVQNGWKGEAFFGVRTVHLVS